MPRAAPVTMATRPAQIPDMRAPLCGRTARSPYLTTRQVTKLASASQAGPVAHDVGMAVVKIDDPADPRVADYVGLSDAAIRRRFEDPDGGGASPHGRFI